VPIRSYLKSDAGGRILENTHFAAFVVCRRYWDLNLREVRKLAAARGGGYIDGRHWSFAGGQLKSLLSLISYLGKGENRNRYLGASIPPTNLSERDLEDARGFAKGLAGRVLGRRQQPSTRIA
jgi:hypothetical protein